jgi:hypothetical protein
VQGKEFKEFEELQEFKGEEPEARIQNPGGWSVLAKRRMGDLRREAQ